MNERREKIEAYHPLIDSQETEAVTRALGAGDLIGNGVICRRVEDCIKKSFNVKYALLTASCTAALEMAAMSAGIGPGDEVILPSFTFVSTANCIVLRGAKPVFAEVQPGTLNIDPDDVVRKITSRTKAIIPVHYAGVACEMDRLLSTAREHNLLVIEDAAQGVDATYKGKYLGTIGDMGCYSFHATKNVTCGEGGAFVTNSDPLSFKAEIIREKGTNRSAFMRGEVDKYTWVGAGSSYILSDLLAALLEVQLNKMKEIKEKRRIIWEYYMKRLKPLGEESLLSLPEVIEGASPNYHIFFVLARTSDEQLRMINHLKSHGIPASFHYVPLHSAPYWKNGFKREYDLPVTESVAGRLVRLPLGAHMTEDQADFICSKIHEFFR